MRKKDWIIIVAALLLAAAVFGIFKISQSGTSGVGSVVIRLDGEVIGTYSLAEDRTVPVDSKHGHNVVQISGGEAKMIEADCPDKYCMGQGKISHSGQTIVCLPHKLVVEAVSPKTEDKASEPDAVVS